MTDRSLKKLQLILKELDGGSWANLVPFHSSILKTLHAKRINFPFLHSIAQFWDPPKYIFWFNSVELCPLLEEFEGISGLNLDSTR